MAKLNKLHNRVKSYVKKQNAPALREVLNEIRDQFGSTQLEQMVSGLMLSLNFEEYRFLVNQLPDDIKQRVVSRYQQSVTTTLVDAGFVLGRDFSFTQTAIAASSAAKEYLLSQLPESEWEQVENHIVALD